MRLHCVDKENGLCLRMCSSQPVPFLQLPQQEHANSHISQCLYSSGALLFRVFSFFSFPFFSFELYHQPRWLVVFHYSDRHEHLPEPEFV